MLGSDAFFRRLVETSGDGVWAFDEDGSTVFANQRLADLLGYSVTELEAMSVLDVLDDEGKRQFREHLDQLPRIGPNQYDADCVYLRRDGTPVPLTVGEHAIIDDDGALVCYVHRVTDDLLRRDLLTEVSQSRSQLDEAQAIARLGSWDMDLVTGTVTFSRQMFRLLGLDAEHDTPTPRVFFEQLVEADRGTVRAAIGEAHRRGGEFAFDARVRHGDGPGGVVWLRGLGRYKTDESGHRVRVGGTLQDVTEVKEAELQLLDAVVLNALMQVMATAANESRTLVEAVEVVRQQLLGHEDWVRAVGFTVASTDTGPQLTPYLGPQGDPDRAPNDRESTVAEQVLAGRETVFDETTHPQTPALGFSIGADDGPVMVVVITAASPFERHDMLEAMTQQVSRQLSTVAERERATQQLAQARDAAMQASRLKSEFVAMMSHEIRTPMNGVIGLNDLILRSDLDDYQRRLATGVQTAGRSLLGVINDILDFSKIEAGQLELESVEFDLERVVDQTLTVLSGVAADKELQITTRIDPALPARLVGDPTRLGQVVSNLVSNAVKFTHAGRVDIAAKVTGTDGDDGLEVTIEVTDTGVGIPAEVREHLFEPFRQADASTTRTFGGTGLGLAICHQLVAAMGGDLGVRSEPGRGSTFWFTVRLTRGVGTDDLALPPGPVLTDGGRSGERGRILVVEDNDINQLVALGLLEAHGYSAVVVDNGQDAVEEVRLQPAGSEYDAVLMDIQMPGMDGYAAARRIREVEPDGRRTPIIAMTASAMQGERERCLAAGMDDYLSKPVASHRLEHVLARFLGGSGAAPHDEEPAPPPAQTVLDVSRLEELDALGEGAAALVTRAITNFIGNAPSTLAELEHAHRQHDCERVAALAHRLKGSAWNLGALRVGTLCERLELEARSDVLVDVDHQVAALRAAYADAARALRDYRGLDDSEPLAVRAG